MLGISKAKEYLPRPKTFDIVNKQGKIEKITITFLVIDEIIALGDDFIKVVEQIGKDGKNIDLDDFKLQDLPVLKPVMNELKKILVSSIDRDEKWFGKNVSLSTLSILIKEFIEVNGVKVIIENFVKAKALLNVNLSKGK